MSKKSNNFKIEESENVEVLSRKNQIEGEEDLDFDSNYLESNIEISDTNSNLPQNINSIIKDDNLSRYIKNAFSIPNLTNSEEANLMNKYFEQSNNEAGKTIIASHLKLVIKIGFKYRRYTNSLFDLFAEGNLGLIHALKKFNPLRGIKFATYATFWIKSYIQDYIIRFWSSFKNKSKDIKKKLFSRAQDRDKIKIEKDISFEKTYNDNDGQIYQVEEQENFVEKILQEDEKNYHKKKISDAMSTLDERSLFILKQRFFLDKKMTLEELSAKLSISPERIRQIQEKAMQTVKDHLISNDKKN